MYQLMGACGAVEPATPGPATFNGNHTNVSPGSCDIANFPQTTEEDCNRKCYGAVGCLAYVLDSHKCYLKSCSAPVVADNRPPMVASYLVDPSKRTCLGGLQPAQQLAVHVLPTRTVFELQVGLIGSISPCPCQNVLSASVAKFLSQVYFCSCAPVPALAVRRLWHVFQYR